LERHVAPELSEHDLSHFGAHQVAARLVVDWEETAAFTLRTEAAPAPIPGRAEAVRAAARERFGRSPTQRQEETVRRSLAGARGSDRGGAGGHRGGGAGGSSSGGRPPGSSPGRPVGSPELPGSVWTKRHVTGSFPPAGAHPDSWSDQ